MKSSRLQRKVRVSIDVLLEQDGRATVGSITQYLRDNDRECEKLKRRAVARTFTPQLVQAHQEG